MEQFVRWVLAGGIATVAGLWAVTLSPRLSPVWLAGAAAVGTGVLALGYGIGSRIERDTGG